MRSVRGPFVGVTAVVFRDGRLLLGRRIGSHGAGTWAFPGGKLDAGEDPAAATVRELREETGLLATEVRPIRWTSDVLEGGLHFITLHHLVVAEGDPVVREPDKAAEWRWVDWRSPPGPVFQATAALFKTGWEPADQP